MTRPPAAAGPPTRKQTLNSAASRNAASQPLRPDGDGTVPPGRRQRRKNACNSARVSGRRAGRPSYSATCAGRCSTHGRSAPAGHPPAARTRRPSHTGRRTHTPGTPRPRPDTSGPWNAPTAETDPRLQLFRRPAPTATPPVNAGNRRTGVPVHGRSTRPAGGCRCCDPTRPASPRTTPAPDAAVSRRPPAPAQLTPRPCAPATTGTSTAPGSDATKPAFTATGSDASYWHQPQLPPLKARSGRVASSPHAIPARNPLTSKARSAAFTRTAE